jgi:hypothetical protein
MISQTEKGHSLRGELQVIRPELSRANIIVVLEIWNRYVFYIMGWIEVVEVEIKCQQ